MFGVLAAVFAAQPGMADTDLGAIKLSDLRVALRAVEADLSAGLAAPADVSGIWATLPLFEKGATASPSFGMAREATSLSVNSFLGAENAAAAPDAMAATPKGADGGLFSIQLSEELPAFPSDASLQRASLSERPLFEAVTPITQLAEAAEVVPQDVDTTNFRLMLATLSQTYTGQNAMAVVNAQGPRGPVAVSVRAGTVSLTDLQSYAAAHGMPPLPDGTMTVPVVIWPDATLRLSPGERMALSRDSGAFILSMGTLDVDGATIEVSGPRNSYTPSFVPFVTVTGGGSLNMNRATLRGLGFGQTAKFSGLSVAGSLLTQNKGNVVIRNSLFDGLQNLTIAGVSGARVSGNTFINARNNTLYLINSPGTLIEDNLFSGGSHTNSIRVDKGSHETQISKNILMSGQRVAILVTGSSDYVQVRENLIWKRQGAGVKFLKTRCGLAQNNVILDNRQKGVEVRKSDGTVVNANLISGNGNAGIWVSAQGANARTLLSANILSSNGSGVSAATGAEILMNGNDLSGQLPRLLDGDIARLTRNVVEDLRGATALRIKDGHANQDIGIGVFCGSTS